MPVERSAGAIIFRKEGNRPLFLLLHYPTRAKRRVEDEGKLRRRQTSSTDLQKEYWDLPKGHIEKGEKLEDTVKREVEEETGLKNIEFIEGFKETIKYFFKFGGKNIVKFVTFYLAETKQEDAKVSFEHLGYQWLPYEEAVERLTFGNAKNILQKANDFLCKNLTKI